MIIESTYNSFKKKSTLDRLDNFGPDAHSVLIVVSQHLHLVGYFLEHIPQLTDLLFFHFQFSPELYKNY